MARSVPAVGPGPGPLGLMGQTAASASPWSAKRSDHAMPVGGETPVCRKITGFFGRWYVPREGNNCKADEVFATHTSVVAPAVVGGENLIRGTMGDSRTARRWVNRLSIACETVGQTSGLASSNFNA